MKAIWMKKGIMTMLTAAMTIGQAQSIDTTSEWEYGYTGAAQSFDVKATGTYQFELYGAQGGTYGEHAGGKGGMVSVRVDLHRNDQVELLIGGSDGYNGGGQGTLSNGGGATSLQINGKVAAIAGGGGGATDTQDGGIGGDLLGAGSTPYTGDSSTEPNSAGGGGGYLGGLSGYTRYHEHLGNPQEKGGCYIDEIRHEHSGKCYVSCGEYENFRVSVDRNGYIEANCSICGEWAVREGDMDSDFLYDGSWTHTKRVCGKDMDDVESYKLSCGKTEKEMEENTQAYGGTNHYDATLCRSGTATAGVQAGNGRIRIRKMEGQEATITYCDYNLTPLGSVTVLKGDTAIYPLQVTPSRKADAKYEYEFRGWDDMDTEIIETMSNADTVQLPVTGNRNYIAVYRTIPQKYTISLIEDEAAVKHKAIIATYGKTMPEIALPKSEDALFEGYYTDKAGKGIQYYTPKGSPARRSLFTADTRLYAYWVQPVTITKQPGDAVMQQGQDTVEFEVGYQIKDTAQYKADLQWYQDDAGQKRELVDQNDVKLQIPSGQQAGEYDYACEITVTSTANGQKITLWTNQAHLTVEKTENAPSEPGHGDNGSGGSNPDKEEPEPVKPDTENPNPSKPDAGNGENNPDTENSKPDTGNGGNSPDKEEIQPTKPSTGSGKPGKDDVLQPTKPDTDKSQLAESDPEKMNKLSIASKQLDMASSSTDLVTIGDINPAPWNLPESLTLEEPQTDEEMRNTHPSVVSGDSVKAAELPAQSRSSHRMIWLILAGLGILGILVFILCSFFLCSNHEDPDEEDEDCCSNS